MRSAAGSEWLSPLSSPHGTDEELRTGRPPGSGDLVNGGRPPRSIGDWGGDLLEVPSEWQFDQPIPQPRRIGAGLPARTGSPERPVKDPPSLAVQKFEDGLANYVERELREQLLSIEGKLDLVSLQVENAFVQNNEAKPPRKGLRLDDEGRKFVSQLGAADPEGEDNSSLSFRVEGALRGYSKKLRRAGSTDVLDNGITSAPRKSCETHGETFGERHYALKGGNQDHRRNAGCLGNQRGANFVEIAEPDDSSCNPSELIRRTSISFEVGQSFEVGDRGEIDNDSQRVRNSEESGSSPMTPTDGMKGPMLSQANDSSAGGAKVLRNSRQSMKSTPSSSIGRGKGVRIPDVLSGRRRSSAASNDSHMEMLRKTIQSHKKMGTHQRGPIASQIWIFIENPYSSNLAWVYSFFVPAFIVSSVIISIMQTTPDFPIKGNSGLIVQAFVEVVFSVELVVRFIVCPDRVGFWSNFFNYIDLVSTAPVSLRLYILIAEAGGSDTDSAKEVLTVVAVVPVLRLMKLTRRFEKFQLLLTAFQIAFEALPVLLYTMMLICLIFSAVIYTLEEQESDQLSSLPKAMWFILVTMTTVGYGDITPATNAGHITSGMLMVVSALYMAMPIGIVGNAFSQVWGDRDRLLLMQRLRDAFLQGGFSPSAIQAIMQLFDSDGSGEVDREEFQVMLRAMQINLGENRVHQLFNSLDKRQEGAIHMEVLMHGLFPSIFPDPHSASAIRQTSQAELEDESP